MKPPVPIPQDFIRGVNEDGVKKEAKPQAAPATPRRPVAVTRPAAPPPPEVRKQMVMMLPVAVINDLKARAWKDSLAAGVRVSQQMVVETALRKYLYE